MRLPMPQTCGEGWKPLPLQTAQWSITAMTMREMYAQQQTETETR